ncbi:Putative porin [Cnuella takakiae]|uniref:Putative porin n=1 Tax=Cnuella takakiae TaxID=1302690 RepID=A0A1M5AI06_9BACT|nr:putative porin [Cnuella takakiae]OLY91953.1 hypothetical protein BUE76_08645 [Cnuella takakiae]SHF29843.1 Putative porin [Cnuella takakiae]
MRFVALFTALFLLFHTAANAQMPGVLRRIPRGGGGGMGGGGGDSLQRRDRSEDSVNLSFRFLDSNYVHRLDSSLNDFTVRQPIPAHHTYLGNVGTATRSLLFAPGNRIGFDPGFHAFDVYKWDLETLPFYNTSRPFTQLGYLLGGNQQQQIEVLHTQNIRPYWNFSLHYRLINSPGFFKSQKTNHNNYLFNSYYQAPAKRYNNYFVVLANSLQSGENGGIQGMRYLDSSLFSDRFNIPVRLGGDPEFGRDFFNSNISTGNRYVEFHALMRQQYDLGRKDSIVTDSSVIPLFYPRVRFEHTLHYNSSSYRFFDQIEADTAYYESFYKYKPPTDSMNLQDRWRILENDFSIYQFPDAKNLQQFLKLGAQFQLIQGQVKSKVNLFNIIGYAEYRNRTRNKKWELEASGRLHLGGYNIGDYRAYASLRRNVPGLGSLQIGGENINRSPSFQYDTRSQFYLDAAKEFNKENRSHFFGNLSIEKLRLQLYGDYYLVANYLYLKDFYKLQQEGALFNVLRVGASKTFRLGRYWRLYSDVHLQQKTGDAELNIPLLFTRNRLAFEGLFFKNLNLSTGVEMRYHTPYEGDDYSPVLGRFFYQEGFTINNRPDVTGFFHFRIRNFNGYVRAENLNAFELGDNPGFTANNLGAPEYPYPGMVIRFGFYWTFLN